MDLKKKYRFYSKVAFSMAVIMLAEIIYPTATFALTSGPGSPEFSSFEPVATTSMVNEFSGTFTYNIPVIDIPGANGGGYACSLSYHSGETVESEASWVGYGWTLNPGAINRSKRGFADDSRGDAVTYKNDVPANWTISVGATAGNVETFSMHLPVSVSASLRYNNYRGFGYTAGIGYSKGIVSLGYSVSDGTKSFSLHVNPAQLLSTVSKDEKLDNMKSSFKSAKTGADRKKALEGFKHAEKAKKSTAEKAVGTLSSMGSAYGMHALGDDLRATSLTPYTGQSFNMTVSAVVDPLVFPIGGEFGLNANFTRQKNETSRDVETYGYMYSSEATATGHEGSMMDYYTEKESTYNKRDRYMSIPFSNADIYSVTGEGVGGGFRLYNKRAGVFYPNEVSSTTLIGQVAVSAQVGLDIGIGTNLGEGLQTLDVKRAWSEPGNSAYYNFATANTDEGTFFRFNNDLGGSLSYSKSTSAVAADLYPVNDVPGLKTVRSYVTDDINQVLSEQENGSNRSGRSSYIAYHTNGEMGVPSHTGSTNMYYAYEKDSATNYNVSRSNIADGVGEVAVFNEDGNRYVYGLPVYSRNEKNMQYDLRGVASGNIHSNFVAYKDISTPFSQVGEIHPAPYATSYLITEITTPDFVDRKLDGPSDDDFGGYTKFSYTRAYGSNDKKTGYGWYHWRIPYTGLSYNANDLTDNLDDMGSLNSGEKEVYYTKAIETKTHIAVFITNKTDFTLGSGGPHILGSGAVRQDGVEAGPDETAAKTPGTQGTTAAYQKIQMLERIELYAKPLNAGGSYKLLKTTHFEYDYSTCGYVPNNLGQSIDKTGAGVSYGSSSNINKNRGKLTLKKVWFEYEGVANAKISPYVFDYKYPVISGSTLPAAYSAIKNYGSGFAYDSIQNPSYSPFNLDRWGNPQPDGAGRHDDMKTWVDQTIDTTTFDPAAWQLKKITLPSGGEILVQYEQNDYRFVQDRNALAMVSLQPNNSISTTFDQDITNKYYLNVEDDLGITTLADKQRLASIIRQEFQDKKIYFKFLYALIGGNPQLHSCNSDYVKGYADLFDAGVEYINGAYRLYVQLGRTGFGFDKDHYELPRNVCMDYVKTQKGGKLKPFNNCDASAAGVEEKPNPLDIAQQLISKIGTSIFPALTCADLKESLSYFRIPMLHAKKGGGIRVKRILMHDIGIETGDESLYGSEYIYKTTDGESSGVATNEPSEGKEENALITFLPKRNDQGLLNILGSGKDKEQFEGPMGEYLLPSASVGYSRVVVKNIHSGKTNTGFVVNEYNTVYDYPFDKNYNSSEVSGAGIDNTEIQQKKDWLMIPASFVTLSISNLWLSQGYRFVINEMHGQPKSISTYSGDYNGAEVPNTLMLSSQQLFSYYEPGEKIPMMTDVNTITFGDPGKETEVAMEQKSVEDIAIDGHVEVDFSLGLLPIVFPVYITAMPSVSYTESKLRTHVTSKIIRYPAIQKSVETQQDGIKHLTENIAFSPYSGKPLLTKTTDGYDALNLQSTNHIGSYLSYSVPAAKEYKEMGQKASNERLFMTPNLSGSSWANIVCSATVSSGNYSLLFTAPTTGTVCNAMNALNRGDLVRIKASGGTTSYFFHIDEASGSTIKILPAKLYNSSLYTSTLTLAEIEVIKSGRTNQLNTLAGSFTTYGVNTSVSIDTINSSVLTSRQSLVDNLNTSLHSISGNDSTSVGYSSFDLMNLRGICTSSTGCIHLRVSSLVLSFSLWDGCSKSEDCNSVLGSSIGFFALDRKTGSIFYYRNDNPCSPIMIPCLKLCPNLGLSTNNVVAASASTFDYTWPFDTTTYKFSTQAFGPYNDYETGVKGKWRMASSYTYNSPVISGSKQGTTERNYKNAGVFPMVLFNWQNASYNDTSLWVRTTTVSRYSPNGEAIEEKDAIGIKSSAKYGYKGMLPYMITQNSEYKASQFESFENVYGTTKLEEGVTIISSQIDNTKGHSGSSSFKILNTSSSTPGTPSTANLVLKPFKLNSQISSNGLELKVWVKDPGYTIMPIQAVLSDSANSSHTQAVTFSKVAQTGEWTLYSSKVTLSSVFTSGVTTLIATISSGYPLSTSASTVWIDDVRMQPFNSQAMSYVYDTKTLKLIASFDDQHFGLYYQYNAEGKLVRKKIETEKGLKTIQETQYHTPVVKR